MRLIDADDAIAKYAHYGIWHSYDATDLEEILNEMPTIEIVRCKDCKYYEGLAECNLIGDCMGTLGFCAWGERKESE